MGLRLLKHQCETYLGNFIRWAEFTIFPSAGRGPPPSILYLENEERQIDGNISEDSSYKPEDFDGFLWGVPKKRRTVEKRTMRKFGAQKWVWKLYVPKTNIRICDSCGHHYEAKHLCPNCYEKVKQETEHIRKTAEERFGDSPENKEIVVLYENEKSSIDEQSIRSLSDNKVLVELTKPRPEWFHSNLLQKSTAGRNTTAKKVVPTLENPKISST